MKRGDLVTIAVGGDYGKPRPAVVVQADEFSALSSVTVLRLTSELHGLPTFRVTIQPTLDNGLRTPSQIMIDRAIALPMARVGPVFGRVNDAAMRAVSRVLAVFLGLDRVTTSTDR